MIKRNQKNMRKYDKRISHINNKIHVIYISSNNVRHPLDKTYDFVKKCGSVYCEVRN